MNVVNFDLPKDTNNMKINPLYPKRPFRMIMVGKSGAGKTTILLNLLTQYDLFDKFYMYTRHITQDKYVQLKEIFTAINEDENLDGIVNKPVDYWSTTSKDMIPIENLDKSQNNVIVFDDLLTEKQQSMIDAFIAGRQGNASVIYLTQSYFDVPKTIRLQANIFLFFNCPNKTEARRIAGEHSIDFDKDTFYEIWREATKDEFGFFYYSTDEKRIPLKYRKNFDGLLWDLPDENKK